MWKGNRANASTDLCGICHRDDQEEECAERSTLPFFCCVLTISGTSVASHHHLPIFCSFQSLSSWRNLCVINISSFHLHALPPKLFSGRCLLWVSQSACVACRPPAVWCCAGVCGVKSKQLVSLKMSWSRFFAGPLSGDPHTWVTHHPCASHMLQHLLGKQLKIVCGGLDCREMVKMSPDRKEGKLGGRSCLPISLTFSSSHI